MNLKILVTAGDGIGPEVTNEAVAVLQRSRASSAATPSSSTPSASAASPSCSDGTPLPADTLAAALDSDAVLLGAVGGNEFNSLPPDKRPEAGLLQIRAALGGFANLRPAFAFKELAVNSPLAPGDHRRRRHSLRPRTARRPLLRQAPRVEHGPPAKPGTPCATPAMKWPAWPASPSSSRRSAARNSPASTRPTCLKSRSSGAPR